MGGVSAPLTTPVYSWSRPRVVFILSWMLIKQVQLRERVASEFVVRVKEGYKDTLERDLGEKRGGGQWEGSRLLDWQGGIPGLL